MCLGQLETMALRLIPKKTPMAGGTILHWFWLNKIFHKIDARNPKSIADFSNIVLPPPATNKVVFLDISSLPN
jgi:hypothetical protein